MLALTNIALRRGPKVLFDNASLQVHAGQRMGVIGANGSGKSSLFAAVLGELETDAGEIRLPPAAATEKPSTKTASRGKSVRSSSSSSL